MSELAKSNRLAVLAADIRDCHERICRSHEDVAKHAVEAGRWLAEAKANEEIPRGGWERWVEREAGIAFATAKHYISIFRAVDEQRIRISDVAEVGLHAARKAMADASKPPEQTVTPHWTDDQRARRNDAETGLCVIANMHEGADEALITWAEATERFVRIDRRSDWGNPFEMPADGERAEVVGKFTKFYLPHKDGLLARMHELRGKVLGCWCYPNECHGHVLAEVVNREANGDNSAANLVDEMADIDG